MMSDDEMPEHHRQFFTREDYERRAAIDTYTTVISPACICGWEKDEDMWKLVDRKEHCVLHGLHGVF